MCCGKGGSGENPFQETTPSRSWLVSETDQTSPDFCRRANTSRPLREGHHVRGSKRTVRTVAARQRDAGLGTLTRHTLHLGVGMASIAARHPHSQGGNPPLSTRNWAKRPKAHAPKRIAAQARTSEAWGVVPLPRARFRHIGKTFPQLLLIFSPVSHGLAPPHSRQWTITCWIIQDLEIF